MPESRRRLPAEAPPAVAQLLERPVSFHPALARLCGSVGAGLMLSQAIYWSTTNHVQKRDGWFYKNWREWQEETCLGRREQDAARSLLRSKGFIVTETMRINGAPTLHYRVNWSAIMQAISNAPNGAIECTDTCNPLHEDVQTMNAPEGANECTERCKPIKEAETSTETTTEIKTKAQAPFILPAWIPPENWGGFEDMRKKIRKPMTDRARGMIVTELFKLKNRGHPPGEVLDQSTRNCWQDVWELKEKGNNGNGKAKAGRQINRAGECPIHPGSGVGPHGQCWGCYNEKPAAKEHRDRAQI